MYYVWVDNLSETRKAMSLYEYIEDAVGTAQLFERDGYPVYVREAATGKKVYHLGEYLS